MKSSSGLGESSTSSVHHTTRLYGAYIAIFKTVKGSELLSLEIKNLQTGKVKPLEFSAGDWPTHVLKVQNKFIVQTKTGTLYLFDKEIENLGKIKSEHPIDLRSCKSPEHDSMPIFMRFNMDSVTVFLLAPEKLEIHLRATIPFSESDKLPYCAAGDDSPHAHDWIVKHIPSDHPHQLKIRTLKVSPECKVEKVTSIDISPSGPFLNRKRLAIIVVDALSKEKTMLVTHVKNSLHVCLVTESKNSNLAQCENASFALSGKIVSIQRAMNNHWVIAHHKARDGFLSHANYFSLLDYSTEVPRLHTRIIKIKPDIADWYLYPNGNLYIMDKNGEEHLFEITKTNQNLINVLTHTHALRTMATPLLNLIAEYEGGITAKERPPTFHS